MKSKKNLKSLSLSKKTISNLNAKGGTIIIITFPQTYKKGCLTDPRICDPVSFPVECFPIDTLNCPVL